MASLRLTEAQLDELWTYVKKNSYGKKLNRTRLRRNLDLDGYRYSYAPIVNFRVGRHFLEDASKMIQELNRSLTGIKPLFVSDELQHYATALEEEFSHDEPAVRTGKRGRPANPKRLIDEDLDYATVKKTRKKGHISSKLGARLSLEPGKAFASDLRLLQAMLSIPSYIERGNLSWRLWDAHLTRKAVTFAKARRWLEEKLSICIIWYDFVRRHGSL
jgi:hypothetical protein